MAHKRPRISPLKQSGSWMLQEHHIFVSKPGFDIPNAYLVEIVELMTNNVVYAANYTTSMTSPCEAALAILRSAFGRTSDPVKEFEKHYPCDGIGAGTSSYRQPGLKMDDDLEGGPHTDSAGMDSRWSCV